MENNLLKYIAFVKAVEKGSFSKAAQALNYAQSSVSKMIADLENECGVILLERGKNGIRLTPSGEQLLPYMRDIVNVCDKLNNHIDQLNGIQSGVVRIGTFSSVAINWLPSIFAEFQKAYPHIDHEILLGDYVEIENWLNDGRVDCAFLSITPDTAFDVIHLKSDEYKVVLPPDHPLTTKTQIDIQDLNGQPFLLLENGGKTEVTQLLEKYRVYPQIRFSTWEDFAIMAMVEKGLGISILPEMILKRIPYRIEIRPLKAPFYREIGIAMRKKKHAAPAVIKFIEYLEAFCT